MHNFCASWPWQSCEVVSCVIAESGKYFVYLMYTPHILSHFDFNSSTGSRKLIALSIGNREPIACFLEPAKSVICSMIRTRDGANQYFNG